TDDTDLRETHKGRLPLPTSRPEWDTRDVPETIAVGSASALRDVLELGEPFRVSSQSDVVIVPTAAAFTGATQSAIELSLLFEESDAQVEALMNIDRTSSDEPYFATRILEADL